MPIDQITTASLDSALNAPTATALSTASGSAPSYSARAWVNFNGTGTVAIRASGNVSSITDNGTGHYTANFTTAMPDTDYVAALSGGPRGASSGALQQVAGNTNAAVRVQNYENNALTDLSIFYVAIFR